MFYNDVMDVSSLGLLSPAIMAEDVDLSACGNKDYFQ